MLAKAVQDHNPGLPGLKGTTLSQHYKANALKPSLASSLNTIQSTHSTASNPLKRTASQANGRSPFSSQDQGLKRSLTDTARASAGGGRVEKLHDTVFFDENDFQDDADVDLDEETLPLSREHSDTLLPDPVPKKTTTPQTPVNSTPLPWSSSPLAHHNVPPPKLQTTTATNANMTKRRTLPWLDQNHVAREEEADRETPRRKITDGLCEDLTGAVPISSQQARLAKDKKQRARYLGKEQVDKQCVELNGTGLPGRTIHDFKNQGIPDSVVGNIIQGRETRAALEANGEDRPRNTNRYTLPGLVVEKIVQRKEEKATSKAIGNDYTPLPKDNVNSPYPWNKTASAVKEEQRKLRQGHKKLVKDLENQAEQSKLKRKRESVARPFLSDEQRSVLKLVAEQQKSVFFTGSAGTGKSVLLRETIKVLRDRYKREPDRVAVTASTGLAACNVGGVTLHSFAGIGLGKEAIPELVKKIKRNQKTKSRWMRTKVLIIDEISMVDGDLFDKLEGIARAIRNNGRPFGGIQLVITGDFFQLPPVPDQGKIAKFSFDAATWNTSIEHTIGLTQVFRQKDPGTVTSSLGKEHADI